MTLPRLVGTVERLMVSPWEEETGRGLVLVVVFASAVGDVAVEASVMMGAEEVPCTGTAPA